MYNHEDQCFLKNNFGATYFGTINTTTRHMASCGWWRVMVGLCEDILSPTITHYVASCSIYYAKKCDIRLTLF